MALINVMTESLSSNNVIKSVSEKIDQRLDVDLVAIVIELMINS